MLKGGEKRSVYGFSFIFVLFIFFYFSIGHHTPTTEGTRQTGFDGLPATEQDILHPTDVGVGISHEPGAVSGSDYQHATN